MPTLGTVKEIYIYPFKSLPGIKLDRCKVTTHGVVHPDYPEVIDRKWMIVTENGSFQTQRQHPKMALIRIALDANGFQLSAPNMKDIQVPFSPGKERITCRVWKLEVPGLLYGQEIGEWFSAYLEKANLSLVAFGDALLPEARKCVEIFPAASKEGDAIMYSDASPFLVISESSLADLNGRLEKRLPIRNFRPNFFVAGCQGAYAEVSLGVSNWQDTWTSFKIGEVCFHKVAKCTRCLLTTVDTETGVKDPSMEPLKTLKTYRIFKEIDKTSPIFGVHCALLNNDQLNRQITVNDEINEL